MIAFLCHEILENNGVLGDVVYWVSFDHLSFEAVIIEIGLCKFLHEECLVILCVYHFVYLENLLIALEVFGDEEFFRL